MELTESTLALETPINMGRRRDPFSWRVMVGQWGESQEPNRLVRLQGWGEASPTSATQEVAGAERVIRASSFALAR